MERRTRLSRGPLALTSRAISRFQDLEFTSGRLPEAVSVHLFDQFVRGGKNTRFANQSVCSDPEGWWESLMRLSHVESDAAVTRTFKLNQSEYPARHQASMELEERVSTLRHQVDI